MNPYGSRGLEETALKAWGRLANTSKPFCIEALQLKKMKPAVFRIYSGNRAGFKIIAKRCRTDEARREQIVFEEYLSRLPIAALRVFGLVSDEQDGFCWLFVEDAAGEDFSPTCKEHQLLASRWLGELHGSAADWQTTEGLRDLRPSHYLACLLHVSATILQSRSNPALSSSDVSVLQAIVADCDLIESEWKNIEAICGQFPETLVHGSFGKRNMHVREQPPGTALVVFDWGAAGWGSAARDIAKLAGPSVSGSVEAYYCVLRKRWPALDIKTLKSQEVIGKIFRCVEHLSWWVGGLQYEWLEKTMYSMRKRQTSLNRLVNQAPWLDK